MTSQKDFKRLVRARMQKTGEAYTAARAKLLAKPSRTRNTTKRAPSSAPAVDYAKLAGHERRGREGEDRVHVGPVGSRARLLRAPTR